MYRNPLNNGDLSDYNFTKKEMSDSEKVKKYEKVKLETAPTELQKYYQYLTYKQSILDEINYIAERMRSEDINKQKNDFNFIEDLRIEREKQMKERAKIESLIKKDQQQELFGYSSLEKTEDMTPTINTELELEIRDIPAKERVYNDAVILDLDTGKKPSKKKSKNGLSYNQPLLLEDKQGQGKKKYEEALKKFGLSTTISDTINKPIIKSLPAPSKNEKAKELFTNISANLPINTDLQRKEKINKINSTIASQADTQINIPRNKRRGGRPEGSKNKPKRTLDIRPTTLNL